jgi:hypothetical protein
MTIEQPELDEVIAEHHRDNRWSVKKPGLERLLESSLRQEALFFGKKFVTVYQLENGFTILADCSVVNPEKFDLEIGRSLCYERALNELWALEGYKVQQAKFEAEGSVRIEEIRPVLISDENSETVNSL